MRRTPLLTVLVAICASPAAMAQSVQSFTLQQGQAIRITPDGRVDVFATMQGDAAHRAEMERRAQPLTRGLGVWRGADGKLRYLVEPVEGAAGFGQSSR